jgi:hypothetical protein
MTSPEKGFTATWAFPLVDTINSLNQAVKLLTAGVGIRHGVLSVDDDGRGRIRNPLHG